MHIKSVDIILKKILDVHMYKFFLFYKNVSEQDKHKLIIIRRQFLGFLRDRYDL